MQAMPNLKPKRRVRLAYVVSHPIQYQAPLLRRLALEPDIELTVLFGSDLSIRSYRDEGFGVEVAWDTPLLEGYRSRFLPALRDPGTVTAITPLSRSLLRALREADGRPAFDALWVHGYASLNSLRAILAARGLGVPVLLRAESWLGDRPRSASKRLVKAAFLHLLRSSIAATLPIGSHNAEYWRTYFGARVPQFPVPYAVDNTFFAERTAAVRAGSERAGAVRETERHRLPALRAELGLTPGRPVILFASKLQTRKGAADLIEAYRRLCAMEEIAPTPYLVLVGDGEERTRLQRLCDEAGLHDVRFAGFRNQTELPRFFALTDLFVLPSRHEPWGLIVNEAMAAGCPVIVSSEVGAAADLVSDGVEGFVFPPGNLGALTTALARCFDGSTCLRCMGQRAAGRMAAWDFEADIRGLRAALAHVTHLIPASPSRPAFAFAPAS